MASSGADLGGDRVAEWLREIVADDTTTSVFVPQMQTSEEQSMQLMESSTAVRICTTLYVRNFLTSPNLPKITMTTPPTTSDLRLPPSFFSDHAVADKAKACLAVDIAWARKHLMQDLEYHVVLVGERNMPGDKWFAVPIPRLVPLEQRTKLANCMAKELKYTVLASVDLLLHEEPFTIRRVTTPDNTVVWETTGVVQWTPPWYVETDHQGYDWVAMKVPRNHFESIKHRRSKRLPSRYFFVPPPAASVGPYIHMPAEVLESNFGDTFLGIHVPATAQAVVIRKLAPQLSAVLGDFLKGRFEISINPGDWFLRWYPSGAAVVLMQIPDTFLNYRSPDRKLLLKWADELSFRVWSRLAYNGELASVHANGNQQQHAQPHVLVLTAVQSAPAPVPTNGTLPIAVRSRLPPSPPPTPPPAPTHPATALALDLTPEEDALMFYLYLHLITFGQIIKEFNRVGLKNMPNTNIIVSQVKRQLKAGFKTLGHLTEARAHEAITQRLFALIKREESASTLHRLSREDLRARTGDIGNVTAEFNKLRQFREKYGGADPTGVEDGRVAYLGLLREQREAINEWPVVNDPVLRRIQLAKEEEKLVARLLLETAKFEG